MEKNYQNMLFQITYDKTVIEHKANRDKIDMGMLFMLIEANEE